MIVLTLHSVQGSFILGYVLVITRSTAIGVIYPAYASFKAVEMLRLHNDSTEATRWLTYWAVYATLSATEALLHKVPPWIPYYSTLKLAFLLWLQVPRYSGAQRLSIQFIRPFLHRYYPMIDQTLHSFFFSMQRPEVTAVVDAINEVLAHVPVLEWFVRGPDGRPVRPRRPSGGFIRGQR